MTCGVGHGKIHLQQQPTAESEVAISFSGWTASSCPHGGSHHLKVTYAFLPSDPVSCSVAKASASHQWSARAIVMMNPLAVIAPYWNKLLLSLSLQVKRASIRSSRQRTAPPTSADRKYSIFTVDIATSPAINR